MGTRTSKRTHMETWLCERLHTMRDSLSTFHLKRLRLHWRSSNSWSLVVKLWEEASRHGCICMGATRVNPEARVDLPLHVNSTKSTSKVRWFGPSASTEDYRSARLKFTLALHRSEQYYFRLPFICQGWVTLMRPPDMYIFSGYETFQIRISLCVFYLNGFDGSLQVKLRTTLSFNWKHQSLIRLVAFASLQV